MLSHHITGSSSHVCVCIHAVAFLVFLSATNVTLRLCAASHKHKVFEAVNHCMSTSAHTELGFVCLSPASPGQGLNSLSERSKEAKQSLQFLLGCACVRVDEDIHLRPRARQMLQSAQCI